MKEQNKVIDITWEMKKADLKWKIRNAAKSIGTTLENHKELVICAIPVVAGVVGSVVKNVGKNNTLRREQHLKDNYIWDPKAGMHFETRRKLSANQKLEFASRRDKGESVADILRSMHVL